MAAIDLNLVRVFVTLYDARSVTLAAERLHVTQPSVSYALSRLRDLFGDRLFVRSRDGMQPTFTAMQLYPALRDSLAQIDSVLESSKEFEPRHSQKRFRLALTDLGEMALLPRILAHLHAQAPGIELEVVPLEIDKVEDWLATGQVNAAICSRPINAAGVERRVLLSDERYVCLLNRDHASIGKSLSLEQFIQARHAVVAASTGHGLAEDVLREQGLQRKVSLKVSHFSSLPRILQESDLLAILPEQIASAFALEAPLKVLDLPFEVPPFDVALHWQAHTTRSPAQRWFCDGIVEAITRA
ncbi:DNA-binding transcriptional LysR family regulator [Modicisalibacter xianhensis]|uniref:DNA-binding transcriptional LysR family regulator n=1 Tax=Modicisalibacter xianhensis TaxID=442341 RepID=A0A4R8FU30_9GAMM|nr:LysR family transcriptional regulator [Halomonas xianhensis]TDX27648.1 DNA-binding transcriptional LysR family regulator [Halomonas xianhensis]